MRLVPVVVAAHASGPEAWEALVEAVSDFLDRHADVSVALRMPGAAVDHLARTARPTLDRLDHDRVFWLAGGYSDPLLTGISPDSVRLQFERERAALDAAGVSAETLWIDGEWEPSLVSTAAGAGFRAVFFSGDLLPSKEGGAGPIERAGEAVIGVPVHREAPNFDGDGLVGVVVERDALEDFFTRHRDAVTSLTRFLSEQGPGPRLEPQLRMPEPHPSRRQFYRKLTLLAAGADRRSPNQDAILRLQSREHVLQEELGDPEVDLLDVRVAVDRSLRRGDTWVEMVDTDWDADGVDEVHIETAWASLVVDPADGTLAFWDDKTERWPITSVQPSVAAVLLRRLVGEEGAEPAPERLSVQGRSQGRGQASLLLGSETGGSVRLELDGRMLSLELTTSGADTVRMGPEFPLRLTSPRLRVDGSDWRDTGEPLAVSGHRFRFADDTHSILISALRPCELFVHPLDAGGLVVWPHWLTDGAGTYHISMSPA